MTQYEQRIGSYNPTNPTDQIGSWPSTTSDAVAAATARARDTGRVWAASPAADRAVALVTAADRLAADAESMAQLIVREVGKPLGEARAEVTRGVNILRYYAQQALDPHGETYPSADGSSLLLTRRVPHGVVGLITPWNFPVAIPLWKAAPALAFGNAVLLKPAPEATATAVRLADLLTPALPDGLLTVLPGGASTGATLIDAVDAVSFTGSTGAGRAVRQAAAARGIPVQCEMGGQNPSIVCADADTDRAAAVIAGAAMGYAGQKCTATSRVITIGDPTRFCASLVDAVRSLSVGDPAKPDTVVGPVISPAAQARITDGTAAARHAGGRILTGGDTLDRPGWFVSPTVVAGLDPTHALNQEEYFGPIVSVLSAGDLDEAIALANGVDYGLVAAVFTTDLNRALSATRSLAVGMVRVNAATTGVDYHTPFGGMKSSSHGPREQGKAAREFYTDLQTVTISA